MLYEYIFFISIWIIDWNLFFEQHAINNFGCIAGFENFNQIKMIQ